MQSHGSAAFLEHVDDLANEATIYIDKAREVSRTQFGEGAIDAIPLLVVQTAQLMAALDANRLAREAR